MFRFDADVDFTGAFDFVFYDSTEVVLCLDVSEGEQHDGGCEDNFFHDSMFGF